MNVLKSNFVLFWFVFHLEDNNDLTSFFHISNFYDLIL